MARRGEIRGYKTGGRQKGTPNKPNADIKEMILGALSDVGGRRYLAQCARKQPVAFLGLVGKVLPMQIAAQGNGSITIQVVTGVPGIDDEPSPPITIDAKAVSTNVDTPRERIHLQPLRVIDSD